MTILTSRRAFIAGLASIGVSTPSFAQDQTITGAGASFPAPLYQVWAQGSKGQIGLQVNYQSIGSGGGQNQIIARTVDFGATDAPMTAEKLDANNLVQIPSVMGSVVVVVNIPGVSSNQLRLSGSLLSRIFLGEINMWNHADIVAENPTITLPRRAIAPVYRGDGSGTTFVFTTYLASQNREFADRTGVGTSVRWLTGTGARGNEGVSGSVRQLPGSIGYVESAFAKINNMPTVMLKNKHGVYVAPSMEGYISAAQNAVFNQETRFVADLIDQGGENTWPIVSATYLLIPRNGNKSEQVVQWLEWAFANGDAQATRLDYISLPKEVQRAVIEHLRTQIRR